MKDVLSAGKCAELLKALAEPERLRLLQALRERPQSVSDLAALLDNEIGNISHHLKVLRRQGFRNEPAFRKNDDLFAFQESVHRARRQDGQA